MTGLHKVLRVLALAAASASAFPAGIIPPIFQNPNVTGYEEFAISAGDIKAVFIPYGATLKANRWGQSRDIALGYDDPSTYANPTTHAPRIGSQIGRYADRLTNASFTLDGITYNTTVNLHPKDAPELNVTFHGGIGFDYRNFTVVAHTKDTLVLNYFSPDGEAGFPGDVDFYVSHHVKAPSTWTVKMWATVSKNTPLLPTSHIYLQLNGYNSSEPGMLDHVYYMNSKKYQGVDENLYFDGQIIPTTPGAPGDFTTPKRVADGFWDARLCGGGCIGYDSVFVYEPHTKTDVVASLWSPASGIRLDMSTDQDCVALYTCGELANNTAPAKAAHGGGFYSQYSCILFEQQGYGDAVHWPNFGVNEIYGPNRPYYSESTYKFSNIP
ncbi:galactose mutarotase-like domain-containing protein [Crucibulum laeve]|uniref:Galactose mutarotase-like domain-containing protein n=1 Tax=Crucibulum laeve TaxID=68775 RepID=A0A5C3M575_9AGAR|nr:galactose mutarotase-like domain-containing protein [Crucibulum laeve]